MQKVSKSLDVLLLSFIYLIRNRSGCSLKTEFCEEVTKQALPFVVISDICLHVLQYYVESMCDAK